MLCHEIFNAVSKFGHVESIEVSEAGDHTAATYHENGSLAVIVRVSVCMYVEPDAEIPQTVTAAGVEWDLLIALVQPDPDRSNPERRDCVHFTLAPNRQPRLGLHAAASIGALREIDADLRSLAIAAAFGDGVEAIRDFVARCVVRCATVDEVSRSEIEFVQAAAELGTISERDAAIEVGTGAPLSKAERELVDGGQVRRDRRRYRGGS